MRSNDASFVIAAFTVLALFVLGSCVSAGRHAECQDPFNICSDTCSSKCEDSGGSAMPDNLSEAMPSVNASAACAQCVDECVKRRNQCDNEVDARVASEH